MSHQMALCARVIKTGQMAAALAFGITLDDFTSIDGKNLWGLIETYYSQPETIGSVVSSQYLQKWFKNYVLPEDMPGIPIETLCYEVRRERIVTASSELLVKFSEEVHVPLCNPALPLATLAAGLSSLIALGTTANTDVSLKQGLKAVRTKLELMKSGVDFSKMKWPWAILNEATFGVQSDDYVVFYGRPKSMKTWVLCFLIAWAFENEKKILVYTKEMTPDNMYARVLACILKIPYDNLRGATTSPEHDALLADLAKTVENDPHLANMLTVLSGRDVPEGGDTVPWLQSKIDVYKPDLIFIDGLYLLSSQRKFTSDEGRVRGISRDLRAMNLATGVPIIATMQANRKAAAHKDANLDEIAYSDALSQDCTIAARVINDKTSPTISIVIGGSREFKLHGFRIHALPATDFTYLEKLDEKAIQKAKEADQSEEEDKEMKANKKAAGAKREPKHVDRTAQLMDECLRNVNRP